MSVRRDKKKEKEKRERIDKNIISMEDFLNKHAEFIAWLEDEKHKKTKKMSSPKMKTYFKEFMKLWNKRKLPVKYYRGSTDTESPRRPTSRGFSFDEEETFDSRKQLCKPKKRLSIETMNVLDSPFSTFGKTPPKLLQSPSIRKLETHMENEIQNGYASINNITETSHDQVFSEYQVPVKQVKCDTDSNKENSPNNVQPYSVTLFPWATGSVTSEEKRNSDLSSDHFSSSSSQSSHSSHSHDFPVYAQPLKPQRRTGCLSSQNSQPTELSTPDIAPPLPPPLKSDDYLESGTFSSGEGDYKSITMDDDFLPPPPPEIDSVGDDSILNATLPPPPPEMCHSEDEAILNATLPPPPMDLHDHDIKEASSPGYAEIGEVHKSGEGEWKPPSLSKIYSPRKFKLTKSSSSERIYSEVPPPVPPKPKRKMFFEPVYTPEDNTYVEMNSGPGSVADEVVSNNDEGHISYSDYAVPVDVIQNGTSSTDAEGQGLRIGLHGDKLSTDAMTESDSGHQETENIYAECYDVKIDHDIKLPNGLEGQGHNISHHYEEMNCNPEKNEANEIQSLARQSQPVDVDTNSVTIGNGSDTSINPEEVQMRTLIKSAEPHIFRTSGKGSSQVFSTPLYCSIEDMVKMDSKQNTDEIIYDQIDHSMTKNPNSCETETTKTVNSSQPMYVFPEKPVFKTFQSSTESTTKTNITKSDAAILETDIDSVVPPMEIKKTMKRVKSSETMIW